LKEVIALGVKCMTPLVTKNLDPPPSKPFIKPPAKVLKNCKLCRCKFNTEIDTIKMLSKEAQKQNKVHKVIIMIEWALREGVMGEELVEFYGSILSLPNIEILGIGM
jgi:predicted amino acid racemase